jgi:hypothetical protein
LQQLGFGEQSLIDGNLADGQADVFRFVENFPELAVIDVAQIDEDLAKPASAGAVGGAGPDGRGLVLAGGDGLLIRRPGGTRPRGFR